MAGKTKSSDEQPKAKIAKQVITQKRIYFVPAYGISVEAESAEDAAKVAKKQADKSEEAGDD
jgi:hypothetical protein